MEDARARRARLEALRRVSEGGGGEGRLERDAQGKDENHTVEKIDSEWRTKDASDVDVEKVKDVREISFRNYIPRDEQLKVDRKEQADVKDPDVFGSIEVDAKEDVLRLGGEKANWDIKRDIERKREALEIKTREAMNELVRKEEARRLVELGQAD